MSRNPRPEPFASERVIRKKRVRDTTLVKPLSNTNKPEGTMQKSEVNKRTLDLRSDVTLDVGSDHFGL